MNETRKIEIRKKALVLQEMAKGFKFSSNDQGNYQLISNLIDLVVESTEPDSVETGPRPPQVDDPYNFLAAIMEEVARAEQKHPKWPVHDFTYAAGIVCEESGELIRAAIQFQHEKTGPLLEVRKEAIQTAATCIRLLRGINEFKRLESIGAHPGTDVEPYRMGHGVWNKENPEWKSPDA